MTSGLSKAEVIPAGEPEAPSVSLVLPAYNEAGTIVQAIREADDALAALCPDYEVLVVDDGSSDQTVELARAEARTRKRVKILSHPHNRGYGAALRTGFAAARMDLVGFTDADCQFDVREIERLILLCERHDAACGYRLDRKDSWLRRLLAKGYNVLAGALFGLGVRDCDCAMKLVRREAMSRVACETDGFFIDTELLARLRRSSASIVEVGVTHRPRLAGTSTVSLGQVRRALTEMIRFWWTWTLFPGELEPAERPAGRWPARSVTASILALVAVAGLLLLSGLSHPLMKPDEVRYAKIPAEMLAANDFVVPTLDGRPYLDKPPLLYWLVAGSYELFGQTARAARLPGAIASLLSVLLVFGLGRLLVGARAGLLGAFVLLTTIGLTGAGHYLSTDSILVACTTAGLLSLFVAMEPGRFRPGWSLVAGAACGLGFLAKGPVALILVLPPVLLSSWLGRERVKFAARRWLTFLVPVAALAVPWFVLIARRQPDFLGYFFWRHNLVRYASGFDHDLGWWIYLPVIVGAMLPASALFPSLLRFMVSGSGEIRGLRTRQLGFLVLAGVWPVFFFSLSASKLPSYILPALPPLCLLLGALLDAALKRDVAHPLLARLAERTPRRIAVWGLVMLALVALADIRFDGAGSGFDHAPAWVATTLALALAAAFAVLRPRLRRGWWLAAAMAWWVTLGFLFLDFYPEVAELRTMPKRALAAAERLGAPRPAIVSVGSPYGPGLAYMTRDGIEDVQAGEWERLRAYSRIYPRLLLIMDPGYSSELASVLPDWRLERVGARNHIFLASSPAIAVDEPAARRGARRRPGADRRRERLSRLDSGVGTRASEPGTN